MKDRFSVRLLRASSNFLTFRLGSRTSSLAYVIVATLICLVLTLCGYLRRDGAAIQFVRATYNTGLSFEKAEWTPTMLKVSHLHFDPQREDPEHANSPGWLFDSLDSANVDSITIQWGWSFLPQPTAIAFNGVYPQINTQKLQTTLQKLRDLPTGPSRTFAIVLDDCRPELTDWRDGDGKPWKLPLFSMTVGPEVKTGPSGRTDFSFNLVMRETGTRDPLSFRITLDGHGATYIHAGNCRMTPERWIWIRRMLHENLDRKAWWMADAGLDERFLRWTDGNDLTGNFSFTLAAFKGGGRLQSLEAQAAITDLQYRPQGAPDGSLQALDLQGTVTARAQYDRHRGSFLVDLAAGNRVLCRFDPPAPGPGEPPRKTAPKPVFWEGWLERNQAVTGFRLAGTYRYLPEFAQAAKVPEWLETLPEPYRGIVVNLFACTQVEGAELRADLADGAELRLFAGQRDMQHYDASITVRAPHTGPSAGAWAQADMSLAANADPKLPAPVKFKLDVFTDRFPVPGRNDMVYTGKFHLNEGSFTRAWIDRLLLQRDLTVQPTGFPWLDPENRRESMAIGDFQVEDGRLEAFGDMKFFVRNVNLKGSVAFQSLEPFHGALTVHQLRGAQTVFGQHAVEFGPEKLTGRMEFQLGYLSQAALQEAWTQGSYNHDPDNLFAVHLVSNARPEAPWEFHFELPWYMTQERPGLMKAMHFPARLFPPGVNAEGAAMLFDVREPIDWALTCWLEPSTVGEGTLAPASLCALPGSDTSAAARVAQALAHSGLPGKRVLIVRRNLSAPNIAVHSSEQLEIEGLALPGVGDTKHFPYPHE